MKKLQNDWTIIGLLAIIILQSPIVKTSIENKKCHSSKRKNYNRETVTIRISLI
jgi:hypothetical protein